LIRHWEPGVAEAFEGFLNQVRAAFGEVEDIRLDPESTGLWIDTVRIIQGYEAWQAHGEMIKQDQPKLGAGIRERFDYAASISDKTYQAAVTRRAVLETVLSQQIGEAILLLPSAPGPAPLREASDEDLESHRSALLQQLALASLFSRPEVSFPALKVNGLPVGVSLIGPQGQDLALCRLAEALFLL
jgi:amidase